MDASTSRPKAFTALTAVRGNPGSGINRKAELHHSNGWVLAEMWPIGYIDDEELERSYVDACYIAEAVNEYESLKARVAELEAERDMALDALAEIEFSGHGFLNVCPWCNGWKHHKAKTEMQKDWGNNKGACPFHKDSRLGKALAARKAKEN